MRRVVRKGLSEMGALGGDTREPAVAMSGHEPSRQRTSRCKARDAEAQTCSGRSLEVMTVE